ncbi:hypothetical protein, partial [Neisseria sicca]|uniref:hypothetical protein n=1 Tax=Neisseria sicca TaxID=490 RepID=UPI003F9F7833
KGRLKTRETRFQTTSDSFWVSTTACMRTVHTYTRCPVSTVRFSNLTAFEMAGFCRIQVSGLRLTVHLFRRPWMGFGVQQPHACVPHTPYTRCPVSVGQILESDGF